MAGAFYAVKQNCVRNVGGRPASAGTSGNADVTSTTGANSAEGCLGGSAGHSKLEAKARGYRLAGNTSGLEGLVGHTIRVRGKARGSSFQVRSAEDISADCRAR